MGDERYAITDHDSRFAGRKEVADGRTPLTAILAGEPEEREASAAVVVRAAARVAERVAEAMERAHGISIDEELLADFVRAEIDAELHEVRIITLRTMLRYLWQDAKNPWDAMKRLLAATRLCAKQLIRGVSQSQMAWILGETKAATQAREKRVVEGIMRAWGVKGFHFEGAQKSEAARATYSRVQQGNRNRSGGAKAAPAKGSTGPRGPNKPKK